MKKQFYPAALLLSCVISQMSLASSCKQGDKTHIWISPRVVKAGQPVNIMAVSTTQAISELVLTNPKGEKQIVKTIASDSGLPWHLSAQIDKLGSGHCRNVQRPLGCVLRL